MAWLVNWKARGAYRSALIVVSLVWILLAGTVHYLTGPQYEFHLIFLLPVVVVCWYVSLLAGSLMMAIGAAVWMATDWQFAPQTAEVLLVNEAVRLCVFAFVLLLVDRLRTELERESALARVDPLTQLSNRRDFYAHGDAEIERADRYRHPLTLISLDLDNFKAVNDRAGHDAGDRVLCRVAEIMRSNIRSIDVAARIGGDEFLLLLPAVGEAAAAEIAAKLQRKLAEAMAQDAWPVTVSLGVATFVTPSQPIDDLVKRADLLLYDAKHRGKNLISHEVYQC